MLVPREVFERTGGFDERLFMYGEDIEMVLPDPGAGGACATTRKRRSSTSTTRARRCAGATSGSRSACGVSATSHRERTGPAAPALIPASSGAVLRTLYYSPRRAVGPHALRYRVHRLCGPLAARAPHALAHAAMTRATTRIRAPTSRR